MLGTGFVYTVDIIAVVLKAALISKYVHSRPGDAHGSLLFLLCSYWTKFEFMSYVGSIVIWVLFLLPLYALVGPIMGISVELEGMSGPLFGSAPFWFVGILVPLICLIRDYTWK